MARGYPKGRRRREQILDVAEEVLAGQGDRAVTIRAVAAGAGLSVAGVTHHFSSRAELLTALLVRRDESGLGRVFGVGERSFLDELTDSVVEATRSSQVLQLHLRLAIDAADPAHPSRRYFEGRYRRFDDVGQQLLRRLQAVGAMPAGVDPAPFTRLLTAVTDGLELRLLHEPGLDVGAVIGTIGQLLDAGRGGTESSS